MLMLLTEVATRGGVFWRSGIIACAKHPLFCAGLERNRSVHRCKG